MDGTTKGDKVAGQLPIIKEARLDRDCVGPHMIWLSLSTDALCLCLEPTHRVGRFTCTVERDAVLTVGKRE